MLGADLRTDFFAFKAAPLCMSCAQSVLNL
jgi:hypothetical protein